MNDNLKMYAGWPSCFGCGISTQVSEPTIYNPISNNGSTFNNNGGIVKV